MIGSTALRRIMLFMGPRRIRLGLGALETLGSEARRFDPKRALVITDPNVKRLGYLDRVLDELDYLNVDVYDDVRGEPSLADLEPLVERVRSESLDLIVGVGGGSVLDSAKIAAMSARNEGPIESYIGADKVRRKGLPLICIPTTSGTGSEVTRFAVIRFEWTKRSISSELIIPDIAIVDPLLTVSLPPRITAYTGLDALSHAVEAMISAWATPFTDALALGAIRAIFKYLKRAYDDGRDLEARYNMSMAATLAGLSFNYPCVLLGHLVGQTIGPIYDLPHGLSVALALPYILDFYLSSSADKIAMISEAAGIYDEEMTDLENSRRMIMWLMNFYRELNVPLTLEEIGVGSDELEKLAEYTFKSQLRKNSPIELTRENILSLYWRMWRGINGE